VKENQTILIVDDIKENIDILVALLQEYDLLTAIDAKTALDLVKCEDIDLILLDIMMPIMDGFEVCKIIKSNPRTANIPIIFITARDNLEDVTKGFKYGAVDYITKPFKVEELVSRVNTHLKLRDYEKNLEKIVAIEIEKNTLHQQMISQQSKQAALGELLMNIAHQWKQPLSSLSTINIAQKIKIENNTTISKDEILSKIEQSEKLINFMSDTVTTFRDFYQPSLTNDYFFLKDSIQNVLDISKATLAYNQIITDMSSTETDEIYGNENEFTQIILSIINNAKDIFIKRKIKNPKIDIKVQNHKITIADNAGGIEENMIDNIFLPYKSSTGGNGIGLYIAKELSKKNGGTISVKNDKNGAIFAIEFFLN